MKRPDTTAQLNQRALDDLDEQIELVRVAYERYFNGVDAMPPVKQHDAVKKQVAATMRTHFTTTAHRFRMNTLRSRLITFEQYWTRILNQIENGTFKRVVAESRRRQRKMQEELRARMRAAAAGSEAPPLAAAPPASTAANDRPRTLPPPPPTLPQGLDAGEARALFDAFVAAKRSVGESTEKLTYPALVRKLAQELPKLQAKHGSAVRLEVATVDGKVKLRARAE